MIVPGGESVAVAAPGECQFCGDRIAGGHNRCSTKCEACDRRRCRIQVAAKGNPFVVKGLTACCGLLPHVTRGRFYCAACPGEGKVPIVLSHDGREITAYHCLDTVIEKRVTVADLAKRRGVEPAQLALRIMTSRSFALRRLRDVAPADMRTFYVDLNFRCRSCQSMCKRTVRRSSVAATMFCEACADRRRSASSAGKSAHARRKVGTCVECGSRAKIENGGRCCACSRRLAENGRHSCGKIMGRFNGRPVCKTCEPTSAYRARPVVSVTITDGANMRTIYVSQNTPLCGVRARALIEPVVLVDDVNRARQFLGSVRLVSGIAVAHTGSASRSLLPALEHAVDVERTAIEVGGEGMARAALIQLRRAGLVDEHGLTPRARAVLAWCRAAGVNL